MPTPTTPNTPAATPNTPGTAPGDEPEVIAEGDEPTDDLPNASTTSGADDGAGTQRPKSKKPDGITPEVQAYLDSELRKARLKATETGKAKGREELQLELEDRNADDTQRLARSQTKVTELQADLITVKNDHARLLMALKVGLPKPEVNFKRLIITDDDDALEADAIELKESLNVAPNGNQPPVHTPRGPRGGTSTQQATHSEEAEVEVTKIGAQATDPMYRGL